MMRTFLTTLFLLASGFAVLTVLALFNGAPTQGDMTLALVAVALAAFLFGARHAYLVRFGRLGLLKPKINWKPLSPDQRKKDLGASLFLRSMQAIEKRAQETIANDVNALLFDEMQKIRELGLDRADRSDDELRSERKLLRFVDPGTRDRGAPQMDELRDVRRKDVFLSLRRKVDDWYAEARQRQEAYQAWLAEVGDTDQSHLLKDGWVAFLEGQPGPDIHLWHGIATDFHELDGDRMDAAFWILAQEACDRATASDFIAGYIRSRLSDGRAGSCGPDERLTRFASIVEAYNAGRYRAHSIRAGEHLGKAMSDSEADAILGRYETVRGIDGLPRPKGLLDSTIDPTDRKDRGYKSPYAFWDDAGLHLAYPGPNWREAR